MSLIADSLKKALKAKETAGTKIPQFNLIDANKKLSRKIFGRKILGQAIVVGTLGIIFSYLFFSGTFDKGAKIIGLPIWETLNSKIKKSNPIQVAKNEVNPNTIQELKKSFTKPLAPSLKTLEKTRIIEPFSLPKHDEISSKLYTPAGNSKNSTANLEKSQSTVKNKPIPITQKNIVVKPQAKTKQIITGTPKVETPEPHKNISTKIVPSSESSPLETKIRKGPKITAKKHQKNRTSSITSKPNLHPRNNLNGKLNQINISSSKKFLNKILEKKKETLKMTNFGSTKVAPIKKSNSSPSFPKRAAPDIFDDSNFYFNMGTFHQEAGDHQKALINYQKAAELDPRNPEIYNNIGLVYKKLRMYDASLEQFMRALYINPNFSKAYNNIGVVYFKKGNFKGAISNYKKAIQVEPDNLETYNNLGIIYKKQNWLGKAQSVYNKALKINSEHPGTNYNLGLLYEEMGNITSAIYFYRRFIKLGADHHPKLVTQVKNHLEFLLG